MDVFFKRENLDPVLYADDGVLLTNDLKDIETLKNSTLLKRVGIKLSEKKKKDGTASCKLITNDILEFVGSKIDFINMTISSKKGEISLFASPNDISKVIWNEYFASNKPWRWEIRDKSYLSDYLLARPFSI